MADTNMATSHLVVKYDNAAGASQGTFEIPSATTQRFKLTADKGLCCRLVALMNKTPGTKMERHSVGFMGLGGASTYRSLGLDHMLVDVRAPAAGHTNLTGRFPEAVFDLMDMADYHYAELEVRKAY
jgi:hypothetical protein